MVPRQELEEGGCSGNGEGRSLCRNCAAAVAKKGRWQCCSWWEHGSALAVPSGVGGVEPEESVPGEAVSGWKALFEGKLELSWRGAFQGLWQAWCLVGAAAQGGGSWAASALQLPHQLKKILVWVWNLHKCIILRKWLTDTLFYWNTMEKKKYFPLSALFPVFSPKPAFYLEQSSTT